MNRGGLFITGTDTDVGKTFVTAGLAAVLGARARRAAAPRPRVAVWKPVQSGALIGSRHADSYRLVNGSGLPQTEQDTVTAAFAEPLAPWLAAAYAGTGLSFERLVAEGRRRREESDVLLVEGAGGWLVPLAGSKTVGDLAAALRLPVLIVARPGLGTVNHTLLTVQAVRAQGLEVAGVVLNGCKAGQFQAAKENAMMIEAFGGVSVLGLLPWLYLERDCEDDSPSGEAAYWRYWREQWSVLVRMHINVNELFDT